MQEGCNKSLMILLHILSLSAKEKKKRRKYIGSATLRTSIKETLKEAHGTSYVCCLDREKRKIVRGKRVAVRTTSKSFCLGYFGSILRPF